MYLRTHVRARGIVSKNARAGPPERPSQYCRLDGGRAGGRVGGQAFRTAAAAAAATTVRRGPKDERVCVMPYYIGGRLADEPTPLPPQRHYNGSRPSAFDRA